MQQRCSEHVPQDQENPPDRVVRRATRPLGRLDRGDVASSGADAPGARPAVVQLPIGAEDNLTGVLDLIQLDESSVPEDLQEQAEAQREELTEIAAENDEDLIEKFFEEGNLTFLARNTL